MANIQLNDEMRKKTLAYIAFIAITSFLFALFLYSFVMTVANY